MFNLIDEPWITSLTAGGERVQLGLRETLARSHSLRSLANESPLIDAALLRLLLAIVHRAVGPEDEDAWQALWATGEFNPAVVDQYLETWRERFDLFHPETPFFQVANLEKQSETYKNGRKPGRELIVEQSSYGAPRELFESRPDGAQATISAARAARWLVALQAFHPGGLLTRDTSKGDPTAVKAGPVCSSAVVAVRGETLFQSLLLNACDYPDPDVFPATAEDAPAWEREPLTTYRKRACRGLLDWLTWQSRRIQLFGNASSGVSEFILVSGVELVADEAPRDPMCAYRKDDKLGYLPIGFREERALWRDSVALLQLKRDPAQRGPVAVQKLVDRGVGRKRALHLDVLGQVPNKASVILTRSESMPLPSSIIEQPELVGIIRTELELAEHVASALRKALYSGLSAVLSVGERSPDGGDVGKLIETSQAIPRFWADMKSPFDTFLVGLGSNPDAAVTSFRRALKTNAQRSYEVAVAAAAGPARTLKGFALGRTSLRKGLAAQGLSEDRLKEREATSLEASP